MKSLKSSWAQAFRHCAFAPWLFAPCESRYPTNTTYYINNTGTPACSTATAAQFSSAPPGAISTNVKQPETL